MRKLKNKKAYYYSIDALIAVIVIFIILFVIKPVNKQKTAEIELQNDALEVLSTLKVGEIDNYYVKQLLAEKNASENNTLLEQIAELYAKEETRDRARELAGNILSSLSTQENIGIWFGDELISSYSTTPIEEAEHIWTARQLVSGVAKGENVRGYSARAFLTRASQIDYFYFGGYIGDGNISIKVKYNGTISSAVMEIAINKDFDLYINNNLEGSYQKTTSLYSPQTYPLPLQYFHSGENLIELKGNNLYIAGGYIKINYNDSSYSLKTKKYLPGVSGVINIYDSFYIPSELEDMEIYLHYNSPHQMFLNIGNKTVYEGNGTKSVTIPDSQLSSLLNYQDLSSKTTPLRLGLYELGSIIRQGNADVVLITDLSRSMNGSIANENILGIRRSCDDPQLYSPTTARISLAQCLDKEFIDTILNVSGNRVAIVGFFGEGAPPNKARVNRTDYFLTEPNQAKRLIDSYTSIIGYDSSSYFIPVGGGCVCCALNSAYKILEDHSNKTTKNQFVVAMSDGLPIYRCRTGGSGETAWQGTQTGYPNDDATQPISASCGSGQTSEAQQTQCTGNIDTNECRLAILNANWSSCRLAGRIPQHTKVNATVYSVGFGPVSECDWANKTLNYVAKCGQGKYYTSSDPEALKEIYTEIASEILALGFIEQVSNVTGVLNLTTLYPDSYIFFNYSYQIPYGLAITSETEEFGNEISEGSFFVPSDSQPVEAFAVSYSASKWTDKVQIYNEGSWKDIFKLSAYGLSYLSLGDPYFIYIPREKIKPGDNKVKITTAISPTNISGGSASDKVIFTILKNVSGYSPIKISASGCIWLIEFYDFTNTTIKVPQNYEGESKCYYTSGSKSYNDNDAINYAIFDLLNESLDFNSDGRVDSKFSSQDLYITENEISGIPSAYITEMQIRVWR